MRLFSLSRETGNNLGAFYAFIKGHVPLSHSAGLIFDGALCVELGGKGVGAAGLGARLARGLREGTARPVGETGTWSPRSLFPFPWWELASGAGGSKRGRGIFGRGGNGGEIWALPLPRCPLHPFSFQMSPSPWPMVPHANVALRARLPQNSAALRRSLAAVVVIIFLVCARAELR